jgi:oligopeptide transport system substrate-binding protein
LTENSSGISPPVNKITIRRDQKGKISMKKLISLVLAVALCLSLVACGSTETATNIENLATAAETQADVTEPTEAETAQELTFVLSDEPDGIDPTVTNNSFAMYVLTSCFEGLVTYDSTGSIVGGCAESWDVSDDGLVYTFHLRDNLKWSDGSDLTASDFVYSFQRVLTPSTTAQYYSMLADYIVGAQEYYDGTGTAEELGVKALDAQTLEITLKQPTSFFIDLVSMWCYDPVQEATITANGDRWTASAETYIGNGPFKMEEIKLGEGYVLVKNENYWNAENVKLEKLTFRFVLDTATALTAYESGEVDGIRSIPTADYARLKASNAGVQTVSNYGTVYYNINCSVAPYDNVLVRKALNLAIDRQSIIDNVVQVDATPAYSFLAPGYSVDGVDITEDRGTFGLSAAADVEAAQAALAEAGYPNGEGFPTLKLSYYSNDTVKKVVEAMAEMFKTNLNIDVEISSNDWAIYYSSVQSGDYEVGAMGWSADYLNPMSFLPLFKTGDSTNNAFYSNSEYDELVNAVMQETDPAAAAKLTLEADAIVSNDYACIPLYYKTNDYLMKDYVKGVYMVASGNMYFQYAEIVK